MTPGLGRPQPRCGTIEAEPKERERLMTQRTTFTLGVNYWPRKKAMYWWKDFDRAEVEAEFGEIAALKLQVARIFLFWEDFQPAPDQVSDRALGDLGTVLDVALAAGIKVMPTFFTGHMSGINWWPMWALSNEEDPTGMLRIAGGAYTTRVGRDPYADPFMLAAERRLVAAVCGRYGSHPAVHSWNFSNEPDLLAPHNDFLSMHAYSIYYALTQDDDPLNSDVVPLACLVTEALGGKRVLFEEFGYANSEKGDVSEYKVVRRGAFESRQFFADDASGGRYYRDVLEKLARCGALGAGAWDFSDYDPCVWHKPPFDSHEHERFFGLTRYDGTVKPSGEAMRACAERAAVGALPPRTVGPLRLDPNVWYLDAAGNFDRLFQEWRGRI